MPLRYGQRRGLSFAWCARRDMGLGTDAAAVVEAVGRSGSHCPLGLSEEEFTRLGRTFIVGMCWFLVKRYGAVP